MIPYSRAKQFTMKEQTCVDKLKKKDHEPPFKVTLLPDEMLVPLNSILICLGKWSGNFTSM